MRTKTVEQAAEDKIQNLRTLAGMQMEQAEAKLREALALLTEARNNFDSVGRLGGGYGMVGDAGHYRHAVAEILSHDGGECGLSVFVQKHIKNLPGRV